MAVAANYFSFTNGMSRHSKSFRAGTEVTPVTNFRLISTFQHRIGFRNKVTAGAGYILAFMDTGMPLNQRASLMTLQAHTVLHGYWRRIFTTKGNQTTSVHQFHMCFTRSMTGFATFSFRYFLSTSQAAYLFLVVLVDTSAKVIMTCQAGFATNIGTASCNKLLQGLCLWLFSVVRNLRIELFNKLIELPNSFFDFDDPDPFRGRFVVGQNCSNCHTQVHGSNHPSGINLLR